MTENLTVQPERLGVLASHHDNAAVDASSGVEAAAGLGESVAIRSVLLTVQRHVKCVLDCPQCPGLVLAYGRCRSRQKSSNCGEDI